MSTKRLREIAVERYEEDGGTMCECFGEADYAAALEESHGDPEAAWKAQVERVAVRREIQACYDC